MLPNTQEMIQMCSFDASKSTKGASKLRRDLINAEIANLRDLLPLPSSTRQRLSQLQLMALVCVYVRKANYFQQVFRKYDIGDITTPNIGFSKALSGFLLMMTQNGKLLYISDNAAEYLGHSMEDLLIHGDSVYDIIDKQDHQAVQTELTRNAMPTTDDERIFLCRMNVSRNARRQMRFGDQKVVLMQGHFLSFLPLCSRNEPVFLGTCTPVAMPETRECVVQGSTNIFTSIHTMDMKFVHLDKNGEFHLGYTKEGIQGTSWYQLIHWDNIKEAQGKHRIITQTDQERACILLLRLQVRSGSWLWLHVVLQVKDNMEGSQYPVIVCTNQVLSEKEATVMRANNWLYHYYTVQSKLQYSLALQESHAAAAAAAAAAASAAARMQPTYYHHQTLMAYPPHPHLQQPDTHLHPHLLHHHHHHHHHPHQHHHHQQQQQQQLGSSSLNGSQHHSSSTATSSSHYSTYGHHPPPSDSTSYHYYHHTPTGSATDCTTNQSPPTSPSTSYPRLTSLAGWMPATPPDLTSGTSPVSPIWLNKGLSYEEPTANTKEPPNGGGTQPSNLVRTDSPSLTIEHEPNGAGSGTVQLLSSPAIVLPASRSIRAKYERKLRQMGGRTLHRETYGVVSEDDDDSIRSCREDLMSTIPSPSHSDPQTVPDLGATVIVSGRLVSHPTGSTEVFRTTTEQQQHVGGIRSNMNDIVREESFLPHWTTMDNREVAMEQYVPDMIRRRSEDDSFATSDFYTWNGVNTNYRTLLQSNTPEFDLRKSFYHMSNNYQRHVQSLTSLVTTSDGETASSLHTSPSPSYSVDGSPEFAFPHTPESWPSILPFGMSSNTFTTTDGHSGDEDPCGQQRKKRKLSSNNNYSYNNRVTKDDISTKSNCLERSSNSAITDSVTNYPNGESERRTQCLCNANTCSPHCPCLKVMLQGQTLKNVSSKTWKHCCSLKVDTTCKRNMDSVLDYHHRSYGCNNTSDRSVLMPQTFKVELKSDTLNVDKSNRDNNKSEDLDDHKTHH